MPQPVLSLGGGVNIWLPQTGTVHSVFPRAVNLLVGGEMWTVLGASHPDAPFGIRLAQSSSGLEVAEGDRVHVRAGFVSVGKLILDCRTATRWIPTRWAKPASGLAARLSMIERAARPHAWAESARMASDVIDALRGGDSELASAVRRVVGRGPGLTPAGDDVLVGILALHTSGAAGTAGDRAASRLANALTPMLPTTSNVSGHLLQQAARGLPGRALHDLGQALMEGAPNHILADAIRPVLATGSTSGADACMGLVAACRSSFPTAESIAA